MLSLKTRKVVEYDLYGNDLNLYYGGPGLAKILYVRNARQPMQGSFTVHTPRN
jgi:hypothetical protein